MVAHRHYAILLVAIGVSAVAGVLYGFKGGSQHLGAEGCRACHPRAYQVWKGSRHSRALEALSPAQRQDSRCTRCHTLGEEGHLRGVQCESCHGPGRYYYPSYVMRDRELSRALGLKEVDASTCLRCHDEGAPNVDPFDHRRRLKLIDHSPRGADEGPAADDQPAASKQPAAGSRSKAGQRAR